jgi:hypothetical protein
MRLGWDEIARRAKAFSEEWKDARYEKGETQSFYNDFFEIFGIRRRTVAVYEQRVKLLDNKHGFIDLFWPGTLLVEQKSGRLDLGKAQGQALDYLHGVHSTQQPQWILTCDFQNWVLLDLDTGKELKFRLADLHKHVGAFDFMLGRRVTFETQAGVTIKAAELMGKLHDALEEANYTGHDLEQLLVRLLFCLFADDTGIFQPKDIFLQLIENDTRPDGTDTGRVLNELFDVLDCPEGERQKGLAGELDAFPYVNGRLFSERLRTAVFDKKMREYLLDAARHDWSGVSPAIFGSLFQSVMNAKERRAKGAHYTSEENILKVIGPLFLDELREELERIKARKTERKQDIGRVPEQADAADLPRSGVRLRQLPRHRLSRDQAAGAGLPQGAIRRPADRRRAAQPRDRGPVLRHRVRRIPGQDRRGGDVDDGPHRQQRDQRGLPPQLRPHPAQGFRAHPPRRRAGSRLGGAAAAGEMQLCDG